MINSLKKGFTLTELIISLAIVGLIAVLAVPALMNDVYTKAYINQLKNMSAMLEQLAADQMINKRTTNLSDTDFKAAANLLTTSNFAIVGTSGTLLNGITYKKADGTAATVEEKSSTAIRLKNGVVLGYAPSASTDTTYAGTFILDVNGTDNPNMVGRDLFVFKITKKGKIASGASSTTLATCNGGDAKACYGYLVENNWKY